MPRSSAVHHHIEGEVLAFGFVAERADNRVLEVDEQDIFRIDRHHAGFNFRKVQNVTDEIQKIRSRAMDRAREFHLLCCQVAVRIFTELLTENEDAIKRSPQFVRHVGQKVGFIF